MTKYFQWLPESWIARFGFVMMIIGLAIVLIYHGIILAFSPLETKTEGVIGYTGHVVAFIGSTF